MKTSEKKRIYNKNRYEKNKEIILKKQKERYEKEKIRILDSQKKYYNKNKEKIKNYQKTYNAINKEKVKQRKRKWTEKNKDRLSENSKLYRENNKEKIKKYKKDHNLKRNELRKLRKKNDYIFKLSENTRCLVNYAFRSKMKYKCKTTSQILGCTFKFFKEYIESKFESWMSWDNHGFYNGKFNCGWDLDHIIPISTAKNEDDVIKLNHYTNFQPLDSHINRDIKKDKLIFHL